MRLWDTRNTIGSTNKYCLKSIYRELGPGQRISLAKIATESLETKGRPLRLAIDVAIWQFQSQAARGASRSNQLIL